MEETPKLFYQFTSSRFDTIFLFLYKSSTIKASKLFGYAYVKALQEPVAYYIESNFSPEFSLN